MWRHAGDGTEGADYLVAAQAGQASQLVQGYAGGEPGTQVIQRRLYPFGLARWNARFNGVTFLERGQETILMESPTCRSRAAVQRDFAQRLQLLASSCLQKPEPIQLINPIRVLAPTRHLRVKRVYR